MEEADGVDAPDADPRSRTDGQLGIVTDVSQSGRVTDPDVTGDTNITTEQEGNTSSDDSASDEENDQLDEGETDDRSNRGAHRPDSLVASDGRELSEYEILRLERIRRNKEYLARLGLDRKDGAGRLERKKPTATRKRQKSASLVPAKRSSLRARKSVDYSEPSVSVASLLRANGEVPPKKPVPSTKKQRERKGHAQRMDKFIYKEFKRLEKHRTCVLREAEKNSRIAEKEVKFWTKMVDQAETRESKLRQQAYRMKGQSFKDQEKALLGGITARDLLRDVDNRMADLQAAAEKYDDELKAMEIERNRETKYLEEERKIKLLDALERSQKTLKSAGSLLDSVLLERIPQDVTPVRRSHRASLSSSDHQAKVERPPKTVRASASAECGKDWFDFARAIDDTEWVIEGNPGKKHCCDAGDVGGWVSPTFAEKIDRSWLDADDPPGSFDVRFFVPQAGDTVLYYPVGHKEHLACSQDTSPGKSKNNIRTPLWERAVSGGGRARGGQWCTKEWLEGVSSGSWDYPILCLVERARAEFPRCDPFKKTFDKNRKNGVIVHWKAPRGPSELNKFDGIPLRLSVCLRPLMIVDPFGPNASGLEVPPVFCVSTFPSEAKPFLIPFCWAYSRSALLSVGDKVHLDSGEDTEMRISAFLNGDNAVETNVFDRFGGVIESILSARNSSTSVASFLDAVLSRAPKSFPRRDALVVAELLQSVAGKHLRSALSRERDLDLFQLITETLPRWNSVLIMKNVYVRKKIRVSAWDLNPKFSRGDPIPRAKVWSGLDEVLQNKIDAAIRTYISASPITDMFHEQITDDDAPSYSCAVPLAMSLDKVLRRLSSRGGSKMCYYRTVSSLMLDLDSILDNCILYNSPESEVVTTAEQVVSYLRERISHVARLHYKELRDTLQAEEDRRRFIMGTNDESFDFNADIKRNDEVAIPPIALALKKPQKEVGNQEWLQHSQPSVPVWTPQAGDIIAYSASRHSAFVKAHQNSLDPGHCVIPSFLNDVRTGVEKPGLRGGESVWSPGKVVWTRADFSSKPLNISRNESRTFPEKSTLLAVGLSFDSDVDRVTVIYWRPCRLAGSMDHSETSHEASTPHVESKHFIRNINFLKQRCTRGESVTFFDQKLTKENVKSGHVPPASRVATKSLPSFEYVLSSDLRPSSARCCIETRGAYQNRQSDHLLPLLSQTGFLPSWACSLDSYMSQRLQLCSRVSPTPRLCLELILLRLEKGYYRHRSAIENDIIEAYVTCCLLTIGEAASRKRSSVSLKRLTRLVLSEGDSDFCEGMTQTEENLTKGFRVFRDLHSMALFAVVDSSNFQCLAGLNRLPTHGVSAPLPSVVSSDPVRASLRRKLEWLLLAVGKDKLENEYRSSIESSRGSPRIKVVCNGAPVTAVKIYRRQTHLHAIWNSALVKTRILCNKKVMSSKTLASVDIINTDDLTRAESRPKRLKIKLRLNRKQFAFENQSRLVAVAPSLFGNDRESREVCDSIILSKADFEDNEALVRLFFGRPGRMNPCGRCSAHRRNLFTCRVLRCHSNYELDWVQFFEGQGGVDGLLHSLHPQYYPAPIAKNLSRKSDEVAVESEGRPSKEMADDRRSSAINNGVSANFVAGQGEKLNDDDLEDSRSQTTVGFSVTDPRELLAKARTVHELASEVLNQAQSYFKAPARLDKNFIQAVFPIDPGDGHFIYCVLCGLSGDLLCCDGCSNVVHSKCIGLDKVPEGDWFCEECHQGRKEMQASTRTARTGEEGNMGLKSAVFDEEKNKDVCTILDELNSARPERFRRTTHKSNLSATSTGSVKAAPDDRRRTKPSAYARNDRSKPLVRRKRSLDEIIEVRGIDVENKSIQSPTNHRKARRTRTRSDYPLYVDDSDESSYEHSHRIYINRRAESASNLGATRVSPSRPLDALSTTARSFLKTMKVCTAEEFLSARSSDLASAFINWRKRQGMAELKGSGPIATVSGWKSIVRRAVDEANTTGLLDERGSGDVDVVRKGRSVTLDRSPAKRKESMQENHLNSLSSTCRSFLRAIHVSSVKAFLETPTTSIASKLVKWRKRQGMPALKGSGSVATVSGWKTIVRNTMAEFNEQEVLADKKRKATESCRSLPNASKRTRREERNCEASTIDDSTAVISIEYGERYRVRESRRTRRGEKTDIPQTVTLLEDGRNDNDSSITGIRSGRLHRAPSRYQPAG